MPEPVGTGAPRRTPGQIREHYLIEKELAGRLRTAGREERRTLYTAAYDEMFRRVPHHPMLASKATLPAEERAAHSLALLAPYLGPRTVFLELGPGDCALATTVARRVRHVVGVDVSTELTSAPDLPANFELLISDGTSVPVPANSVDLAFSNQLMEHLHPDDALEQLRNIHRALKPGGRYICLTPNRVCGPHDISRHFDEVATCFHLKEYTTAELASVFRQVGFRAQTAYVHARGRYVEVPLALATAAERVLARAPRPWVRRGPLRKMLAIGVAALKEGRAVPGFPDSPRGGDRAQPGPGDTFQ